MSKPVALILGATGTIGRATVKHLAANSASKLDIRAGTRNPSTAPDSIKLPGVKVVKATVGDDEQYLKEVFSDVDRLFLIAPSTDFPAAAVNAAAAIAKETKVKHLVVLTAPSGEVPPNYKYVCAKGSFYHIESKAKELYPDATLINHPFFMENILGFASSVKNEGKFSQALHPDRKLPWMAADDAGKFNAAILSDPEKHKGKYYRLNNDMKSYSDLANFLGEALGKKVEYGHLTYEQFKEVLRKGGAGETAVETFSNLYHLLDEGHESVTIGLTQDHFNVTGEHPITLQQWCHQNAQLFQ